MSKRKDPELLEDIKEAIEKIILYTEGIDHKKFIEDSQIHDAVVRNLEIIGEATKNISSTLKGRYPEVPWRKLAQLRDVLIHQYDGVNLDVLWEIIEDSLRDLERQIEDVRKKER